MDLSVRATRDIKLLYKGRNMSNQDAPVREYGVKNHSEILAVVRDLDRMERDDRSVASTASTEEIVILGEGDARRRKRRKDHHGSTEHSPNIRETSASRQSPEPDKSVPGKPISVTSLSPIDKLDAIAAHLDSNLIPQCNNFVASPPRDAKKFDDEHRKLSETIFQQVLLKLDGVDTEGNEDARARRKQLVKHTQGVLKRLDDAKLHV